MSLILNSASNVDASDVKLLICFHFLPDTSFVTMFPFQWNPRNWPAQSPQMESTWGPMFQTTPMAPAMMQNPQSQFCGPDPMIQQAQAQSQAQIQALNQQNALLNQQLHAQHMTHMQNLQQLATHTAPFIESSTVHSTNRSPSISLSCRTYANSTNSSSWTYTPVVQH